MTQMTQSTIFNISLDIVQLGLLLGSVDPETHVLCELYNIDVVLLLKEFVFFKKKYYHGYLNDSKFGR